MGSRGRKSSAELSVVAPLTPGKPPPPADMPAEQATIWRDVVGSENRDHFRTRALQFLLADFCRHVAAASRLTALADNFELGWLKEEGGLERLERILKMRDREARGAADKATKLRLTNQSRYTPQAAATVAKVGGIGIRPWDYQRGHVGLED